MPPEDVNVLVRVRNKNKPDGIYLYDICRYDSEYGWANHERAYTWEKITDWKYICEEDYYKYEPVWKTCPDCGAIMIYYYGRKSN